MKTEYRTVCDGIVTYLEYKRIKKRFFFDSENWVRIWRPYYDKWYGRDTVLDSDLYVTTHDGRPEDFVKRWPDIQEYFKWAQQQQDRLEQAAKEFHDGLEKKKGIAYL